MGYADIAALAAAAAAQVGSKQADTTSSPVTRRLHQGNGRNIFLDASCTKTMQATTIRRVFFISSIVMPFFAGGAGAFGLVDEFAQFAETTCNFMTPSQTSAAPESYAFLWNVPSSGPELPSGAVCSNAENAGITIRAGNGDSSHHIGGKTHIPRVHIALSPAKATATANGWMPGTTTESLTVTSHERYQNSYFVKRHCANSDQQGTCERRDAAPSDVAGKWAPQAFRARESVGMTTPGSVQELIDTSKGVLLNIPPRVQWLNDKGYCGETTIQSFLLYFGGYASQEVVRQSVGGEVVMENIEKAIDNFALNKDKWRGRNDSKNLMVWMKRHLQQGHPLTSLVYIRDMNYSYHIVPFIGYESFDITTYHKDDVIIYNPLLGNNTNTIRQRFGETVAAKGLCRREYCICKESMYGIAIKGNKDTNNDTLRARLEMSSNDEPNVPGGDTATLYSGVLHIYGLTIGKRYSILRYNDYRNVPASNFLSSNFTVKTDFIAVDKVHTFNARFTSDGVAIYRVVKTEKE